MWTPSSHKKETTQQWVVDDGCKQQQESSSQLKTSHHQSSSSSSNKPSRAGPFARLVVSLWYFFCFLPSMPGFRKKHELVGKPFVLFLSSIKIILNSCQAIASHHKKTKNTQHDRRWQQSTTGKEGSTVTDTPRHQSSSSSSRAEQSRAGPSSRVQQQQAQRSRTVPPCSYRVLVVRVYIVRRDRAHTKIQQLTYTAA